MHCAARLDLLIDPLVGGGADHQRAALVGRICLPVGRPGKASAGAGGGAVGAAPPSLAPARELTLAGQPGLPRTQARRGQRVLPSGSWRVISSQRAEHGFTAIL
jgi:hypothetical protein